MKRKVKNIEDSRIRSGYIIDTLTSVDIQETVKFAGRVIQNYEGVVYGENFRISPFKKVVEKLFALRQKYKVEKNNLMQGWAKSILNSLYGVAIRKENIDSFDCESEHWIQTE